MAGTPSNQLNASQEIDKQLAEMTDWRGKILAEIRKLILAADADVVEEVKWRKPSNAMRGIPVWSHNGIICTGETYKDKVKLTFAKGAFLKDPSRLFNASLEGISGALSIFMKVTESTKPPSRSSSAKLQHST
jgi:hypothetical protein